MFKQKIYFLRSSTTRMTKKFWIDANGDMQKGSYPMVKNFSSSEIKIETIEELHSAIESHANQGYCLLKGQLDRMLIKESRAGHTDRATSTRFMVLDIDGLNITPDNLMQILDLGGVDYVLQYSASAGITANRDRYHLFIQLDQSALPSELKHRLEIWNLIIPEIRQHIGLSSSKNALTWPLDITVCQNDKIIYIAPPICGEGVHDSLSGDRISLHKKINLHASLSLPIHSEQTVREMKTALINELREKQGLPARAFKTEKYRGTDVLKNSDPVEITSVIDCGDFVRLNLNGGNSDAYWHPKSDPSIIRNFKDEPYLLTKKVAPSYYVEATQVAREHNAMQKHLFKKEQSNAYIEKQQQAFLDAEANGEKIFFPFRDRDTDQYYVGYHDYANDVHRFNPVSSKQRAHEYLVQHGTEQPPFIETWSNQFAPSQNKTIDPPNRFINQFKPSTYMQNAKKNASASIPRRIRQLIMHVLGNNEELYEHFLNWLTVIFQYRINTQSAWVLQGTTGTGKGLLFHKLISPLIGSKYCTMVTLSNMEDRFNKHLEQCIVLFVDEVDTDQIRHTDKLIAKLKNMITEPSLTIRAMRSDIREVKNHVNILMASNRPNSMRIEENDRRFNICYRQENKLFQPDENAEAFIANVEQDLQQFADYLVTRTADISLAARAIDNEPKRQLQEITQTAIEEVASALLCGDLSYFVENIISEGHTIHTPCFDNEHFDIGVHYRKVLLDAISASKAKKTHALTHKDLFTLFQGLVGDMPKTKTKLTKRLGHVGIQIKTVSKNKKSIRGLSIEWQASDIELHHWAEALTPSEKSLGVVS